MVSNCLLRQLLRRASTKLGLRRGQEKKTVFSIAQEGPKRGGKNVLANSEPLCIHPTQDIGAAGVEDILVQKDSWFLGVTVHVK